MTSNSIIETRNITDYYAYWKTEAIKADLDTKRHQFGVLCCNFENDFNIGSVVRNANAFLAKKVYVYGRKKWDKRGAVGTYNYLHLNYLPNDYDLTQLKKEYTLIAIDNIEGAKPINDYHWPDNVLMCFGSEQSGVPQHLLDHCKDVVYIKQYGSVRSLNVGCASTVVMYDYLNKRGR